MDFETLKALKPAEYEDAATGYRTTSKMASDAKDRIDNQITAGMRKHLSGESAQAALKQLQQLSADFHYAETECGLVSTALDGFAYDMRAAQQKLDAALGDADKAGFTVHSDGSVSFPAAGEKKDGKVPEGDTVTGSPDPYTDPSAQALRRQAIHFHPNPHYGPALDIADRIAQAVKQATTADKKWAPKLRALKADDDLTVSKHDWADAKKDTGGVLSAAKRYLDSIPPPPKDGSPKANAAWWDHLTPQQRADYLSVHPGAIGAMNGLPAEVRDEANRVVLDEARAQAQLKLDAWDAKEPQRYSDWVDPITGQPTQTREWEDWKAKREALKAPLTGLNAVENRLNMTGVEGLPEAYLLGISPDANDHDGRVIIANGNPDTADHTAVYVPGTKTHLGAIEKDIVRGERLWKASSAEAPGEQISTITWFDYNAPNNIPQATLDKYSEQGAPTLNDFMDGTRVAHEGASGPGHPSHTTVIGHSYGSTLAGVAAQEDRGHSKAPLADDVIAVGSPGMQAAHADDLGIKHGHVWAMRASDFSDDGAVVGGGRIVGLGGDFTVPTDINFGSNVMDSDAKDHGGYWDMHGKQSSMALRNQARVIVGKYGKVQLEYD